MHCQYNEVARLNNRLRCGTTHVSDTVGHTRVGDVCLRTLTQSVQHVVVDCVIHKAPDDFAGLIRLDSATRTWLK